VRTALNNLIATQPKERGEGTRGKKMLRGK
jgi:hypothetical protein